ncbi:hypothetical protein CBR_g51007 [Chara braunii]|uniref:Small-subunit processome Utp12 domain-containing protein n=1 Tax=Chara braunii TaxID=69332 RepID=A0A388M862_CHABU|nr:hypothetical protein CBR_g51007 [Chara braunii]|eukprot:GBG90659.1 hypothetical protein CBR_g51007 [Chara braunii]
MDFKFANLLGAPYRGGNLILYGEHNLLTPVGNRVNHIDLVQSESITLPFENAVNVSRMAISPNGVLLFSIDAEGRGLLVNVRRRVVLHALRFREKVKAVKFSPDGAFIAVGSGRVVEIWRTPGLKKQFQPFQRHRLFFGCHDVVTCLEWSADSQWLIVGSKDLVVRIFPRDRLLGARPFLLAGHREAPLGAFLRYDDKDAHCINGAYSISRDGALREWKFYPDLDKIYAPYTQGAAGAGLADGADGMAWRGEEEKDEPEEEEMGRHPRWEDEGDDDGGGGKGGGGGGEEVTTAMEVDGKGGKALVEKENDGVKKKWVRQLDKGVERMMGGRWSLVKKHLFNQEANVGSCDYHQGLKLLVVGFSNGIFGLYQLPEFTPIHLLSISREKITSSVFNESGDWLAFGCARLGQLLVWEWRSETYVLKQQGHYFDVNSVAYSGDSQMIATGADDTKLKVWNAASGFCFVTFTEHTMPITAITFVANNNVVLSASLDGTVRAFDLIRYRNFRTFTTPTPTQFASLAADPSGEVVTAGTMDSFQIYVWSMKTGRLLDVLNGHEAPIQGLCFSPTQELLASSSWDSTVRIWDVFEGKGNVETFRHNHDVLAIAYSPDGKQLASSTLDGQIWLWNPIEGQLDGTIDGRRDVAGGRRATDRRTAANSAFGKCFSSLCYSADGIFLLAAGNSKYVCMYDVAERVLLKRFQFTRNRALDGVVDFLNSRKMTDAGPVDLIDDAPSDDDDLELMRKAGPDMDMPGASANAGRPVARVKCVRFAPTGRSWSAATTEGVIVYSQDDNLVFDPIDLDVDVTPEAVKEALRARQVLRALILAMRLNETPLIRLCVESVPVADIPLVVKGVPLTYLTALLRVLAHMLESSPHLEFLLRWCQEVCVAHGRYLQLRSRETMPVMKALQKGIVRLHDDLASACSSNQYLLQYLTSAPARPPVPTPTGDTVTVAGKRPRLLAPNPDPLAV